MFESEWTASRNFLNIVWSFSRFNFQNKISAPTILLFIYFIFTNFKSFSVLSSKLGAFNGFQFLSLLFFFVLNILCFSSFILLWLNSWLMIWGQDQFGQKRKEKSSLQMKQWLKVSWAVPLIQVWLGPDRCSIQTWIDMRWSTWGRLSGKTESR